MVQVAHPDNCMYRTCGTYNLMPADCLAAVIHCLRLKRMKRDGDAVHRLRRSPSPASEVRASDLLLAPEPEVIGMGCLATSAALSPFVREGSRWRTSLPRLESRICKPAVKAHIRQLVAASGSGIPLDRFVTSRRLLHLQRPATPCLRRRTIIQDGIYTRRHGSIHQKEGKASSHNDPPEVCLAWTNWRNIVHHYHPIQIRGRAALPQER